MEIKFLNWHPWVDESQVPTNESLLVEVKTSIKSSKKSQYQVAFFSQTREDGPIVGRVGDRFAFDRKIVRWATLEPALSGTLEARVFSDRRDLAERYTKRTKEITDYFKGDVLESHISDYEFLLEMLRSDLSEAKEWLAGYDPQTGGWLK